MIADPELLELLDAQPPAWILTRTRRLARELNLRVASLRAASGRIVAETPPIRSLDDWFVELGDAVLALEIESADGRSEGAGSSSLAAGRVRLSGAAEQLVWEQVIASDPGDVPGELLDLSSLATTAAEAWKRICHWGDPPWMGPLSEDAEAFRRWLLRFQARLDAGAFVTTAQLPALVAEALDEGRLDDLRPDVAVLLGFDRFEPALDRLVASLRSRGTSVLDRDDVERPSRAVPQVLRASSRSAEIRTVASRIRARLLEQPGLSVAVLAPDLPSYGPLLERVFEEELDPAGVVTAGSASPRRFDFAEAPALLRYPLVSSGLDLLALHAGPLSFDEVSRVLLSDHPRQSPDLVEEQRARRAALEAGLRRGRSARILLGGKHGVASLARKAGLEAFGQRFEDLAGHLRARRDPKRSPIAWRREWLERLRILGWPGRLEEGVEGLVYRRWRDALEEFAGLETVEPSMGEGRALARLRSICAAMPVQPRSQGLSVKVLSLLDAAGLDFDLVFVVGMTATAFPASPRPNPLLPVTWQRAQAGMPRASVEGERELADAVWTRLLASCREVFVTWPARGDGDEDNTPSALVAGLACEDAAVHEGEPWWLAAAEASAPREPRPADNLGPPLVRSGGSAILTRQSSCGFQAFAATRLGAEALAEVQPQPDAARRGNLVHAALEHAYRAIPSSEDLAGLSDANIAEVARDAAAHAIGRDRAFFEEAADLREATSAWLEELLAAWMLYERDQRTDAWTVESTELDDHWVFPPGEPDPLTVHVRPDRIDRVGDGVVLLDFKTSGSAKKKGLWAGDRPDEPQMILYLALLEQKERRVDGLAFANLSARDQCGLDGLAAAEIAPDCGPPSSRQKTFPPGYPEALASMRSALEGLARDYLSGDASVNPKKPRVCKYCRSQALCRVHEGGAVADDEEDADEDKG